MSDETTLQDELDDYEGQMQEIAHILLDDRLTSDEKITEIETIVFPDDEDDE